MSPYGSIGGKTSNMCRVIEFAHLPLAPGSHCTVPSEEACNTWDSLMWNDFYTSCDFIQPNPRPGPNGNQHERC
jgi:hypothetical protein